MIRIWYDDKQIPPLNTSSYKYLWCKSLDEVKRAFEDSDMRIKRYMDAGREAFHKRDYAYRTNCYKHAADCDIECVDVACGHVQLGAKYHSLMAWLKRENKEYVRVQLHFNEKEE